MSASTTSAGAVPPPEAVAGGPVMLDPRLTVKTVVSGLVTPTAMAFLKPDDFLVLEKDTGRVRRVVDGFDRGTVLDLPVNSFGERGLLGMALSPRFRKDRAVYLYWTESSTGADSGNFGDVPTLGNRVDRYTWNGSTLVYDRTLLRLRASQDEPGLSTHDGGVLKFGPDGKLYVVVGDENRRGQTQNLPSGPTATGLGATIADDPLGGPQPDDAHLAGVVLRLNRDGSAPRDNPFYAYGASIGGQVGANLQKVYAYGIRNSFGLDFDPRTGRAWMSENGDDAFDEINRIEPGFNSGWIQVMGPLARFDQYRQIETTFTTPPLQPVPSLRQARWPAQNLANSAQEAVSRLFVLPGSHYHDPQFSWKYAVGPAAVGFQRGDALGKKYAGSLFVGAGLPYTDGGYLFRIPLSRDRKSLAPKDPRLADKVADNGGKTAFTFDLTESESLLVGKNFGVSGDIQTGPDGHLYVVSVSNGAVYEVMPASEARTPRWPRPLLDRLPRRPADAITVGALGDSYTDEYQFYPPHRGTARNWVELLAATRPVDFGPFTTSSRGEPRDQGFAYNWARSDATSDEMVRYQLPGLARQVADGKVQYAWIFIGGNDFIGVLRQPDPASALAAAASAAPRNFLTAVRTLLAASPDVRLVVATVPEFTRGPEFAAAVQAGLIPQVFVDFLAGALARYNDVIRATAASNDRIALVDLADLLGSTPGTPTPPTIPFGGIQVDTTSPSDDYRHLLLGDGRHFGTIGMGIIADQFLAALDARFGLDLQPLAPGRIVHIARKLQGTRPGAKPSPSTTS